MRIKNKGILGYIAGLFRSRFAVNRKFYHTSGFGDDTDYINYCNGVAHCVSRSGKWVRSCQTLSWLLKCVDEGDYEERP